MLTSAFQISDVNEMLTLIFWKTDANISSSTSIFKKKNDVNHNYIITQMLSFSFDSLCLTPKAYCVQSVSSCRKSSPRCCFRFLCCLHCAHHTCRHHRRFVVVIGHDCVWSPNFLLLVPV